MDYTESAEVLGRCFDEMAEVLLEIEAETNNLYTCLPDDIDVSLERIEKYKEILDEIRFEADSVCAEDETGELAKASNPQADRKKILPELGEIFEKRQEVNAVIYRINSVIPMVEDRMKKSMEKTLEEIKENNAGQSAKAARYYSAVSSTQQTSRLSNRSRSI